MRDQKTKNTVAQAELSQHNTQNCVQPNTIFKHIVHFKKCTENTHRKAFFMLLQKTGRGKPRKINTATTKHPKTVNKQMMHTVRGATRGVYAVFSQPQKKVVRGGNKGSK